MGRQITSYVGHLDVPTDTSHRHGRLMRRKDSPGSVLSARVVFEWNEKGGGHERRRKNENCSNNSGRSSKPVCSVRTSEPALSVFLTWSFFIGPLIACEEFLAAMFKSAAAVGEDAKTAQAAPPQAANDHPAASDLSKTSAGMRRQGARRLVEAHAAQLDPTGLLAQPHEDAPRRAPPTASCRRRDGWGGSGDDAIPLSCAHTSSTIVP